MRIYLVRHDEVEGKYLGLFLGSTDAKLSETGQQGVKRLVNFLKDKKISRVYSSNLKRTESAAKEISKGLGSELIVDKRIAEISFGEWEGQDPWEVMGKPLPEDAEKFEDFIKRVESFIDEVVDGNSKESVLIMAHKGVNRAMLQYLIKHPMEVMFEQDYGCVNVLDIEGEYVKVLGVNLLV